MIIEIDDSPKFDLVSCVLVFSHIVLFSIDKQTFAMNFFSIRQESMVFLFQFDNVCYEGSNEFLVFGKICC
jgi:hypothetical protein